MDSSPKRLIDEPLPAGGGDAASASNAAAGDVVGPQGVWSQFLARHRWIGFVLPFVVYMLAGQLEQPAAEPPPPIAAADAEDDPFADDETDTTPGDGFAASSSSTVSHASRYPIAYAIRIGLTIAAMLLVLPVYRQFQLRVSWLAFAIGAIGAPLWIGLCHLQRSYVALPESVAAWIGGARHGYDPFAVLGDQPAMLALFLAVRFLGLALIVPIIEEFFLRGFLARFVADADWWKIPIGAASATSIGAIVAYAVLTHPTELIAAAAWFLLVTWLVARSKNIWDAVAAHATTNLLLGIWVLTSKQFWLW